ncbi:MAG: type IV toxin-antitoxin system AbiEi family antitoxin [Candidatus Aenigmatarchaeota archaeon]
MSYTISERESEVIEEIEKRDMVVFTPDHVKRFLETSKRNAYRILTGMNRKGLAHRLERGKYILEEKWKELDIYEIVTHLINASYLGFWSALHFHHMTEQVPSKVFLATTKRKRSMELQERTVKFVKIKREDFFGYSEYGRTVASTPEKTVIDCLRLPKYAGGIPQVYSALNEEIDVERLVDYASKLGSSSVASRLGYFLERKDMLIRSEELKSNITTYTKLDPSGERENLNKDWKLYVNRSIK